MNREDLLKIGAVPKTLHVPYGIKTWGEGKSAGGDWGFDVDLSPEADPEQVGIAVYEYLKQVAHKAMSEDLAAVVKPERPKTEGLVPVAPVEHDKSEKSVEIVKFSLAKRVDGKFELKLYPIIGEGAGKYPEIYYVADNDRMMTMLKPVDKDYDLLTLPVEYACEWVAHYTLSEKLTKKGNPYKDLVRIELAH
jgi:hypothetical protein